ncbi:MAG: hypothetical protein Q9227_009577 [Pyrenula ochraceoflavens]
MAPTLEKTTKKSTLPLIQELMAGFLGHDHGRYLSLYTGLPFDNYACGGAACSNTLTPLSGSPPDVSSGQLEWFVQDHVISNSTSSSSSSTLDIPGSETLALLWIGTNDLGIHSLLQPDNTTTPLPPFYPSIPPLAPGSDNATTLTSLANCQLSTIRTLHTTYGIQNFLLLSTIPLHLTRLYAPLDSGTIYWPQPHDGRAWNLNIFHLTTTLNSLLKSGLHSLSTELTPTPTSTESGPNLNFFDTYTFLSTLYVSPTSYFNGSLPANVTGHCHQCPNATDWRYCGIGDCVGAEERDSFMWWDELHPSEQTGRVLAREVAGWVGGRGSRFVS